MKEFIQGDTMQMTWVDSGVTPDNTAYTIYTGSETVVSTGTFTDSGNGHYFNDYTIPSTLNGYYVAESLFTIGGSPYKRRKNFKVLPMEVD